MDPMISEWGLLVAIGVGSLTDLAIMVSILTVLWTDPYRIQQKDGWVVYEQLCAGAECFNNRWLWNKHLKSCSKKTASKQPYIVGENPS